MSEHGKREINYLMEDDAADDESVYAVIDGSVTLGHLRAVVERLEAEAEDRGFQRGYDQARRQYGPVLA